MLLGDLRPVTTDRANLRPLNNLHIVCKALVGLLGAKIISSTDIGKLCLTLGGPLNEPVRVVCITSDGVCTSLRKSVAFAHSLRFVHYSYLFHCAATFKRISIDPYIVASPVIPLRHSVKGFDVSTLPIGVSLLSPAEDRQLPFEAPDGSYPRVEIVGSARFRNQWRRVFENSGVFLTNRLGTAHQSFHVCPWEFHISVTRHVSLCLRTD